MNQLKIIFMVLAALLTNSFTSAQDCGIAYSANTISEEISQYQSSFSIKVWVRHQDSIKLLDVPNMDSNYWFTISSFNQPDTSVWYYDDSLNFEFTILVDTNTLSFYAQKVVFSQSIILKEGKENIIQWNAWVYFTPWRTIEIWNENDYYNGSRSWKIANPDTTEPTRVYFSKSLLPTSTFQQPDTLAEEWEFEHLEEDVENAPFFIKHAAIHPDTMEAYCEIYGDSAWHYYRQIYTDTSSLAMAINAGKTFNGFVIGRLMVRTLNDHGDVIDMPLRGIYVKLKEKDGLLWQDFGETHTDDNGNFTIEFSKWQTLAEGDNLEFYLKYKAKNDNYNFEVIRPTFDALNIDIFGQAVFADQKINEQVDNVTQNIGDVFLGNQDVGFLTSHFIFNCYDYVHDNSGSTTINERMTQYKLKISLETKANSTAWAPTVRIAGGLYFKLDKPTMRLTSARSNHESTIYHEFGHYLMWTTQKHHHISIMDDTRCGANVFDHRPEMHIRKAWSEGFANFTRYMFDAAYWQQDGEYSWRAGVVGRGIEQNEYRQNIANVNNGLRIEEFIGTVIYDLWDGPNKNLPAASNPTLVSAVLGFQLIDGVHPFNDQATLNVGNRWNEPDNIELTLGQLLQPLLDNDASVSGKIHNIYEYYITLSHNLANNCETLRALAQCFRENRILLDINDFENGSTTANWNDNDISITSDHIFEREVFTNHGVNVVCIPSTESISLMHNPVEDQANHITNFPNILWNSGEYLSEDISDDLRLGFNFPNTQSTFNINSGTKTKSDGVEIYTCGNVVWEFGNTKVNIGSNNSPTAAVFFNEGSRFITSNGTIINIANNSSLTIEEGATLRIGPNTEIILDGPNAVLDIKGSLFIESGACFCPTGGSNGQGFVRFNMAGISNANDAKDRIQLGNGSSLQFSGITSSQKLIEVTDHVLWLDNDADNSKFFSIENGKIEMGENAVLNLGIRSVFDHVTITPMSGADDFHGVYLWGHRNTINHLKIEDSRNGLKSFNVVGGYPLLAKNLTLDGCESGLWVEGKGLVYNTGEIKNGNSGVGIFATGMDIPSYLQSIEVRDVGNGVEFTGNKTAALSVTGSTFQVSVNGLEYKSPSSLYSRCSNYYGSNTGIGMLIAAGTLEMSNAFGRSGGGNRFYNTSTQNAFNKSVELLASPVYLHNGINDLKFNTGTGNFALFGRTRDVTLSSSGSTINAAQNFWALPSNDAPQHGVNTFLFQDDLYLTYIINIASPSNYYSIQTNYDNARNTYCTQPGSQGGNAGTGYAMYSNPRSITWQTPNQNVKDVFEEILNDQYDTLNTDNLIPDWETALTAPEWNSNMVPVDWYYIDIGINKMNELAAGYLSNDSAFLAQPDSTHSHLVSLKTVLNHWAQRSDTSSDSAAMLLSQHIQFAKASFYTLVNDYAKALTIYTSLASNADSSLFPLAEYWICQLFRMNQIKDTGTHYMFVDSLEPCNAVYPENYPEPFRDDVKTLDVPKPDLVIYPNPAGNTLNVHFETAQLATILIIDPIGKVVLEKSSKGNKQTWEIDISSLPVGMYMVKCILEDRQKVITLPLMKM